MKYERAVNVTLGELIQATTGSHPEQIKKAADQAFELEQLIHEHGYDFNKFASAAAAIILSKLSDEVPEARKESQ